MIRTPARANETVAELGVTANRFADDDSRWLALERRDQAADGVFYYAVRTTGVYCRPSCPARLAKRRNVQFFMTCAQAERAGFRPCKRCRPNEATLAERTLRQVRHQLSVPVHDAKV